MLSRLAHSLVCSSSSTTTAVQCSSSSVQCNAPEARTGSGAEAGAGVSGAGAVMKIGIIGGTGLDDPDIMANISEYRFDKSKVMEVAPGQPADYGQPSDTLITGTISGVECALLARHGRAHSFSPSTVNYRANLLLLHQFGCDAVIATYSVGSLKEEYSPGHFVIMDQVIDRTQKRSLTYFDMQPTSWPGVCHVSFGEPYSAYLRKILKEAGSQMDFPIHPSGTCVAIEGPRFSSRAESVMYRSWGGHVIGMTEVPEAQLARELHLPFAAVGMVTDYDAWREDATPVTQSAINQILKTNRTNMVAYLRTVLPMLAKDGKRREQKRPGEGDMLGH